MLLNPIVALLSNTATGRWHPILFQEAPLPGETALVRHKSTRHHTAGFTGREEAEAAAKELSAAVGGARLELAMVFDWDGVGVPAIVHFFEPATRAVAPA